MSLEIRVKLPSDRRNTGVLELIDTVTGLRVFGPVPVLGRGARNTATAHGNPNGLATKLYGDTPLGDYAVPRIIKSGENTSHPAPAYGSAGVIVLDPIGGEAKTAKDNGRTGLLIHAGRQVTSPTPLPSHLRPTNGCIRMLERDLELLIKAIDDNSFLFPGNLTVSVGPNGPPGTIDEAVSDPEPPALLGPVILP